jgi:transcriptional regulator with XRE-family HTH domain
VQRVAVSGRVLILVSPGAYREEPVSRCLRERGLTLHALAAYTDVSEQYLGQCRNGKQRLSLRVELQLSEALGLELAGPLYSAYAILSARAEAPAARVQRTHREPLTRDQREALKAEVDRKRRQLLRSTARNVGHRTDPRPSVPSVPCGPSAGYLLPAARKFLTPRAAARLAAWERERLGEPEAA